MFWTEEKLQARIDELEPYRYRDAIPIDRFLVLQDTTGLIGARPPSSGKWKTMDIGESWRGRDEYLWLKAEVRIPAEWAGKRMAGLFDFGRTGGGNGSGFEALLFVNGRPYQGVDSNHREVLFSNSLAGENVSLCFRLWSGLERGGAPREQEHRLARAELVNIDEAADDLYYTAQAALGTIRVLAESDPVQPALTTALNRAFLGIDWSLPGSDRFYETIREASVQLWADMRQIGKTHTVRVTAIGHTHIDVAWLWRISHTREKTARSFSTVLRLMELYPEYIFLQSQPQLYAYLKADYPDLYEGIQQRIREGRWEAGGAMWLEADCNIPSGESLVRQLLHGTRFLESEFGLQCRYLWLPDVFGYSWALPQLLKQSGIEVFMTTKISWNQYNRMPHDTFKWRGIDGTEILTHFITTPESSDKWWYTYNGEMTPSSVKGIWDGYRDKLLNQELLLAYGFGDGGGGVNRDMLEMQRRLKEMPGLPQVETGRADEYFDRLARNIEGSDQYVHTWDGELYLEYHRGTYTSQADIKRSNRKLELLCRETEWIHALCCAAKGNWSRYPQDALNQAWAIILRNQFHDIIPGSSIREVYEDSAKEYEEARLLATEAWERAAVEVTGLTAEQSGITLFNGSPWKRSELVCLESEEYGMSSGLRYAGHIPLRSQKGSDGKVYLYVEGLTSMGLTSLILDSTAQNDEHVEEESADVFIVSSNGIISPFYVLEWNATGQLTRLFDRQQGREVLQCGELGNVMQVFEDKPKDFDAWDIDIFYQEKMRVVEKLVSVSLKDAGELFARVEFVWSYGRSQIRQEMVLYAHTRRIDFVTEVDWREQQQLLKVAFPVAVRATEATYDIQFGNVRRPTHWNTSWDSARFETVGHQWADLSERGYGVSLLNDCKYGYDIKGHVLRLSLIKSAIWPDPTADQGLHRFTYSLYPHIGDWLEGGTVQEAWSLNNPIRYAQGVCEVNGLSLFSVSGAHVMIDAVKKAEEENKIVLRLHEYGGGRGLVTVRSDMGMTSWQACNLLEKPQGSVVESNEITFDIQPYEIKTFIIELKYDGVQGGSQV